MSQGTGRPDAALAGGAIRGAHNQASRRAAVRSRLQRGEQRLHTDRDVVARRAHLVEWAALGIG